MCAAVSGGGTSPCIVHENNSDELYRKLEEERKRCEQIIHENATLRQQLEESNRTNESLTNDLQKLTNDWAHLRDELITKEDEFKEEEQVSIKKNNNFLKVFEIIKYILAGF